MLARAPLGWPSDDEAFLTLRDCEEAEDMLQPRRLVNMARRMTTQGVWCPLASREWCLLSANARSSGPMQVDFSRVDFEIGRAHV